MKTDTRVGEVTLTQGTELPSRNVYDITGQRVLRVDPDGSKTIYLGSTELRWTPGSAAVDVARTYGSGVRRDFDGTVQYTVANHQGTAGTTVSAATGVVTYNHFLPYGGLRAGSLVDDKGFLGQTHDDASSLVYLNNRHYDPQTGVFISVDPLVTKTMQPYIYGAANPVTYSDPSGLEPRPSQCRVGCEGIDTSDHGQGSDGYGDGHGGSEIGGEGGVQTGPSPYLLTDGVVDQIVSAGRDITGVGKLAIGGCGSLALGAVVVASFDGCLIATASDWGLTGTAAAGAGVAADASVGLIFSNAQELDDLVGLTGCVSGGFGAGGLTMCGGLNDDFSFNGVVTVFPSVGVSLLPGSGSVVVGTTFVDSWGSTPGLVRFFLPDLSDGRPRSTTSPARTNPDGSYTSGGQTPYMDTAGVPMAP